MNFVDGDDDLVSGYLQGTIGYFENVGVGNQTLFVERKDSENPFDTIDVGGISFPLVVDTDQVYLIRNY